MDQSIPEHMTAVLSRPTTKLKRHERAQVVAASKAFCKSAGSLHKIATSSAYIKTNTLLQARLIFDATPLTKMLNKNPLKTAPWPIPSSTVAPCDVKSLPYVKESECFAAKGVFQGVNMFEYPTPSETQLGTRHDKNQRWGEFYSTPSPPKKIFSTHLFPRQYLLHGDATELQRLRLRLPFLRKLGLAHLRLRRRAQWQAARPLGLCQVEEAVEGRACRAGCMRR